MTLTSPSTIVISDATQLERLTEIREKLIASPATESTLSDCKDFLTALLAELENKADGDETQPISGTVSVNNFPATQQVAGTVQVSNLPATQPVSGNVGVTNFPATQQVAGTVAISNLPATQPVSGNVGVTNFPATQQVAGTVQVNNFPATQPISLPDAPLQSETALTAVGSTPARSAAGYKYMTYQVDLTGVGTSVTVRVEGNLTGSNYDNLNPSNVDTTLTQNKSYLFTFEGKINNIRFTLVSFSGGSPNLTCHLLRGN